MTIKKIGLETINTNYNVPYAAGYSISGKTLYIDPRIPEFAEINKVKVDIWYMVAIHELVEESLEHSFGFKYEESHKMAIGAEKVALSLKYPKVKWEDYNTWWQPYIKLCCESFTSLPPDLDYEPITDSKDNETIAKVNKLKPGRIK